MDQKQEEKVFYRDDIVTVTQSRFIANQKTYTMRNISSVTITKIEKSTLLQMALLITGILMAIFSEEGIRLLGIVVAIGSFVWMAMMKSEFSIRISTNAGETNTLISENKEYVQKIVNALNEAIIYRG